MNAQAPAVRSDEPVPTLKLRAELEERANEFKMVLPAHISPEKFQRTLLTAVQNNPDLLACDRRSFLTSCMKAAQDGLLPDGRDAAIVPFKTRTKDQERGWIEVRLAQYMPMVAGLVKKLRQSGEIANISVGVVYRQEIDRGLFHYEEGAEPTLRHRPLKAIDYNFAPTDAELALAYSVAVFTDGTKSFEVMGRSELDRVRETSQTGALVDKKGNPRDPKGPWVEWFAEMAKKTVLRRHSKTLPQSGDVIARDVESEDMGDAAARAVVALLDSRQSEPARALHGPGGDPFDPTTGKALPPESFDPETGEIRPDGGPEHNEPEIVAEGFDPATERLKAKVEAAVAPGKPTPTMQAAPEPDLPDVPDYLEEEPVDQGAALDADEEALSDSYINRARACQTIIDLKALRDEAAMDLATMSPELAAIVDSEFAKAQKRLAPAKAKAS